MPHQLHNILSLTLKTAKLSQEETIQVIELFFNSIKEEICQSENDQIQDDWAFILISLHSWFVRIPQLKDNIHQKVDNLLTQTSHKEMDGQSIICKKLPSHLYSNIGEFLTRKQCIQMRHVSKLFYVETNHKSFKIKHQAIHGNNQQPLIVNDTIFHSLKHNLPKSLFFEFPQAIIINLRSFSHQWFNNPHNQHSWNDAFANVSKLRILTGGYSLNILNYIPMDILFNNKCQKFMDWELDMYNKIGYQDQPLNLKYFKQNYANWTKLDNNKEQTTQKKIKTLSFVGIRSVKAWKLAYILITILQSNFVTINFQDCRIMVTKLNKLSQIFHPKLSKLELWNGCFFGEKSPSLLLQDMPYLDNQCEQMAHTQLCTLHIAHFGVYQHQTHEQRTQIALKQLSQWGVLKHLKHLQITLTLVSLSIYHQCWFHAILDNNKNNIYLPKLKNIEIDCTINETCHLNNLIKEIRSLCMIIDCINNNIATITFEIKFVRYKKMQAQLMNNHSMDISKLSKNRFEYLNKQSIHNVCIWLECHNHQALTENGPQMKKIVFHCQQRQTKQHLGNTVVKPLDV